MGAEEYIECIRELREELQSNQQELERGEEIIEAMAEKVSREKEDGSREEGGTRFPIESKARRKTTNYGPGRKWAQSRDATASTHIHYSSPLVRQRLLPACSFEIYGPVVSTSNRDGNGGGDPLREEPCLS